MRRETTFAREGDVKQVWRVVDATDVSLGRLAVEVAEVLMGKHRPEYTPHVPTGDCVIILNGTKVGLTGNKGAHKLKRHYTGYPGGLRAETYDAVRARKPEELIKDAVRRMMPKNRISRVLLKNLHVFSGAEHTFADKKPVSMKV
jgi:large subunit ribosomal protein L13